MKTASDVIEPTSAQIHQFGESRKGDDVGQVNNDLFNFPNLSHPQLKIEAGK